MLWTTIWAVLISLSPDWADRNETLTERAERLAPIAQAIALASDDLDTQAALIAAGEAETKFASIVMEGRCRPGGCDNGRARTVWQLHPWCQASFDPSDHLGHAVCARQALRGPLARCGTWEKAFGGYAAGHGCKPWPHREKLRKRALLQLLRNREKLRRGEPFLPEGVEIPEQFQLLVD